MKTRINLKVSFPICDEGTYHVTISKKIAIVIVKHIHNHSMLDLILGSKVNKDEMGNAILTIDQFAVSTISDVEITLPYHVEPIQTYQMMNGHPIGPVDDYLFGVQQQCIQYLNRLIEVVKELTNQFWLRTISQREIAIHEAIEFDDDVENRRIIPLGSTSTGEILPIKAEMQKQHKKEIERFLNEEIPVEPAHMLQIEAVNYYSMGLYNEVIITLNIAIELFAIQKLYLKLFEKYGEENKTKRELDKITDAKFTRIMDTQFKIVTGKSLKETDQWDDFVWVRELRASVVHPYHKKIKHDECKKAFNVIMGIMNWITDVCKINGNNLK